MSFIFEIVFILVLILLNGILAMAEFAVVSAKKIRLQQRAEGGDTKAAVLHLNLPMNLPIFSRRYKSALPLSGSWQVRLVELTVAEELAVYLYGFPLLAPYSEILAITLVVVVITYLTLIFGELVPKHLALNNAETIAVFSRSADASPVCYRLPACVHSQPFNGSCAMGHAGKGNQRTAGNRRGN